MRLGIKQFGDVLVIAHRSLKGAAAEDGVHVVGDDAAGGADADGHVREAVGSEPRIDRGGIALAERGVDIRGAESVLTADSGCAFGEQPWNRTGKRLLGNR